MIAKGYLERVPERSELTKITGTLKRITKKKVVLKNTLGARSYDITYVLWIKSSDENSSPNTALSIREDNIWDALRYYINFPKKYIADESIGDLMYGTTKASDDRIAYLLGKKATAYFRVPIFSNRTQIREMDIFELTVGGVGLVKTTTANAITRNTYVSTLRNGLATLGVGAIMTVGIIFLWRRQRRETEI